MNDRTELFTIGQLARRTDVPVRTIRFWSDIGVVPPTGRSTGGYRLYDAEAVARLDLVRTLRELGLDLETVRRILCGQTTVADVARTHVRALDTEVRTLRLRRAVLWSIARRDSAIEEMRLVYDLARLSAQERQRIIDDFVDHVFDGIDPDAPGAYLAEGMRQMPGELPEEPTPEQVDAWVELAELVADESFRGRVRQMAVAGARSGEGAGGGSGEQPEPYDPTPILEHAGAAAAAGIPPESAEGRAVLDRIVEPGMAAGQRRQLADELETFTDRRVERYWQLLGVINDRPAFTSTIPAFEWVIGALRAHP